MEEQQRAAYDATRDFTYKGFRAACYAPFTSMYLDPAGDVRVCCQNVEHVLGNVGREPLLDIWRGPKAAELRDAMRAYDLSLGCRFCAWQIDDGNPQRALAHDFDGLHLGTADGQWPQRLELAISNTCNLECVMCDGELSSRIRTRREHRPPLPKVYDDRFFEDLRQFLSHLVEVRFLGGEPFLAAETFRVWDLMIEAGLETPCKVTTNGTQWNARVERVLDHFPVSVAVSLDGVRPETVEAIRVGARHGELMANLERFRRYTEERGTVLELTYCLMQANWPELGEYLALGDSLGARVGVNTVIRPPFSLYHLPLDELDVVIERLEDQDADMQARLELNRGVWVAELERLRHWRAQSAAEAERRGLPVTIARRATYFQKAPDDQDDQAGSPAEPTPPPEPEPDPWVSTEVEPLPPALSAAVESSVPSLDEAMAQARDGMVRPSVTYVVCDPQHQVIDVGPDGEFVGVARERCVGATYAEVVSLVAGTIGGPALVQEEPLAGAIRRRVRFGDAPPTWVQSVAFPHVAGEDRVPGSITVAAVSRNTPAWADWPR